MGKIIQFDPTINRTPDPVIVQILESRDAFIVYGGFKPIGGIRDFVGLMSLGDAISLQIDRNFQFMQVVDDHSYRPYILAEYQTGEWTIYEIPVGIEPEA